MKKESEMRERFGDLSAAEASDAIDDDGENSADGEEEKEDGDPVLESFE